MHFSVHLRVFTEVGEAEQTENPILIHYHFITCIRTQFLIWQIKLAPPTPGAKC